MAGGSVTTRGASVTGASVPGAGVCGESVRVAESATAMALLVLSHT